MGGHAVVVIWAGRKEDAEAFRRAANVGRGAIVVGNHMARSLEGLRPTAVILLDGAGEGSEGKLVREVLNRGIAKSPRDVPWIDLRGKLA